MLPEAGSFRRGRRGLLLLDLERRTDPLLQIGLPRDRAKVPLLCILEPFLAAEVIVTP